MEYPTGFEPAQHELKVRSLDQFVYGYMAGHTGFEPVSPSRQPSILTSELMPQVEDVGGFEPPTRELTTRRSDP